MKKGVIILFCMMLVLSLVSAQQSQTYSSFNRFTDSIKMFFSFGDNKVLIALDIREKEINSAVENFNNGDESGTDKNLEKAWEKLQLIQEKISVNTAEEVKQNSQEIRENLIEKGNLSEDFEVYLLEEEKTGLTAEWVIEVNGKEGQTLTNEVIVDGSEGQNRVVEIEKRIGEIEGEISNWVVENEVAGEEGDDGLVPVIKTEVAKGDNGLKTEVKTYVAGDGTLKNDPLPEPDLNKINPDLVTEDSTKNEVAEGDGGEGDYAEGTTAEGNCGDGIDCGSGDAGTEGTNDIAPAVDSNEGDA